MKVIHIAKSNYKHKNIIVLLILLNYIIITATFIPASVQDNLPVIFNKMFSQISNQKIDFKIENKSFTLNGSSSLSAGNVKVSGGIYSISPPSKETGKPPLTNLETAFVYPNPCKVYEGQLFVKFADLTENAEIKIYTISGKLVKILSKSTNNSEFIWDLKNGAGIQVASGVYIYIIRSDNLTKRGKFVVIR